MEENNQPSIIKVISSGQAIRQRPLMYFGECFENSSLDVLPLEVACHAIDEIIDGKCTSLKVFVFKDYFSIHYTAGMPLKVWKNSNGLTEAEIIMTEIMACSNLKKHLQVGKDLCSIGMAAINFASEWCEVKTVSRNKKAIFKFKEGEAVFRKIEEFHGPDETIIRLKPDKSIFGKIWFSFDGVVAEAQKLSTKLGDFSITVENVEGT